MGYDVHITRAHDWIESESSPITLDQWSAYVEADAEMSMDGRAVATVDGQPVLEYHNDGLAVWTGYSQHDPRGNMAWFDHRDGRIIVKNPDHEILEKMKQVARELSANVLGDDGETY